MSRTEPAVFTFPTMRNLSKEERKSVTHSEFWIPEDGAGAVQARAERR